MVATSGRNRPVASAKPATAPDTSPTGCSATAQATPDVPIESTTSPTTAPSPSAAAALSPVPGPSGWPAGVRAATSAGPTTRGSTTSWPRPSSSRSRRYSPRRRRPVAGAARVAAVGDQGVQRLRAGELPGQPVVGQADGRRTCGVLGLVVAQPAQLGDGERRDRHQPDRVHPRPGTAELVDQVEGGLRGAGVVPQQRRSYDGAGLVEADHAVLLAADRDRRDVVEPAGGRDRLLERVPPGVRVHLGALGMGGGPAADQLTGVRVADDHLAGLGRGVDPGDERHARIVSGCRNARPRRTQPRPQQRLLPGRGRHRRRRPPLADAHRCRRHPRPGRGLAGRRDVPAVPRLDHDAVPQPDRRRPLGARRHDAPAGDHRAGRAATRCTA